MTAICTVSAVSSHFFLLDPLQQGVVTQTNSRGQHAVTLKPQHTGPHYNRTEAKSKVRLLMRCEVPLEGSCSFAPHTLVCLKEGRRPFLQTPLSVPQGSGRPLALAVRSLPPMRGSGSVAFLRKCCLRKCFSTVSCFWGTHESAKIRVSPQHLQSFCRSGAACTPRVPPSRPGTKPSCLCSGDLQQSVSVRLG